MVKFLASALVALGLNAAALVPALAEAVKVTFVLVNDIYEMDESGGRGGFPRLAAVVAAERAANPNTLVVNAGDLISPSLFSGFDQGAHMIVLSNLLGTDVMAPGNHEYDFGKDVAAKRMAESKFPWIAANVTQADGTPVPGMAATWVKEIGGVKIGFVGLAQEETSVLASPGDLKFAPAVDAAKQKFAELRDGGADLVVAINHNTRDIAVQLMAGGADLVLNGHNHDLWLFHDGRAVATESQSDAHQVVAVDVNFDVQEKDGKRSVKWAPSFRIHDTATVTPEPAMAAKVAEYQKELDTELDVALGTTEIELDSRKASVRSMETAMGDLVADGMRAAVGADAAITNGGGIRGDKLYPAGATLTRKDILTELPFGNKTVMLELTGAQIKEALENGVSQIDKTAGRFPQVSGLAFTLEAGKPVGERVSAITLDGKPLDPAASYKVATNDYMANGGDGYKVFIGAKMLVNPESAKLMANDVMAHIRALGTVKAFAPRITIK